MTKRIRFLAWFGLGLLVAFAAHAGEVALVTSASGGIRIAGPAGAEAALRPFIKLRDGDRLSLDPDARLQLVYFTGARQEVWRGAGRLEIGDKASEAVAGGLQPETRILPAILVRQLTKTPATDPGVKVGMLRLRSMPASGTVESLERHYASLRRQAEAGDRTPELFLLAGYFDLREFDRLAALLQRLDSESPRDHEVQLLKSLYERAMADARSAMP